MKLLKELFSSRDYDSNERYDDDEMGGDEEEFNFNFDSGEPELDNDLNFDDMNLPGNAEDEDMSMFGAEEDYPDGMNDMPHDEYEEDGEGGLVSDEMPEMEEELESIKSEVESLYARLGKLAAAGDLNLMDPEDGFETDDMDAGEFDMEDGRPQFASFQDMSWDDDDDGMDFDDGNRGFDEETMEFGGNEMDDEDMLGRRPPPDRPEFR